MTEPTTPTESASQTVALLEDAIGGNEGAWRELFARHRHIPLAAARRASLSHEEAEDLLQRVWLKLVECAASIEDGARLPGWLATTARRECNVVRRQRWSGESLDEIREPATADGCGEVFDLVLNRIEAAALRRAVAQLPTRERRLVRALLVTPAMSYVEISRALGMPVGSIGPVRARALARLRVALSPLREARPAA